MTVVGEIKAARFGARHGNVDCGVRIGGMLEQRSPPQPAWPGGSDVPRVRVAFGENVSVQQPQKGRDVIMRHFVCRSKAGILLAAKGGIPIVCLMNFVMDHFRRSFAFLVVSAVSLRSLSAADTQPVANASEVSDVNVKIAALLGTAPDQILINDVAVNPLSHRAYISALRSTDQDWRTCRPI